MLLSFNMNLDETQQKKVAAWINEGLKLSDIQKRLETECGLRVTYLDLRLMVDDLKLKPRDPLRRPSLPRPRRRNRNSAWPRRRPPPAKSASAWTS